MKRLGSFYRINRVTYRLGRWAAFLDAAKLTARCWRC
jgi:hypothetical protein